MTAVLRGHQVFVGPGRVAIADHNVGGYELAIGQFHALGGAVFHPDLCDRAVVANGYLALLEQMDQGLDNGPSAAHGRVNTPATLQHMDE